ncbi:MAG: hypothetical protein GY714_18790 [Desulfobacterales bacterium]|nr:hypothetical protein [Desulfobacterales bacterium]MCP4160669.1 hypothetical protein [Deltaproteobacteria bacterium]
MKQNILIVLILFLLCGCGVSTDFKQINEFMSQGDCNSTIELLKESKDDYGSKAELLFLLDSAMINMQCGNHSEANKLFQDAEALAQELWSESISQNAAAMVTNDNALSYSGEDFERAMINLFNSIAYLKSKDLDGALIECRKLDVLLSTYNEKYKTNKNVYKEDAFGRYISAILNEADREVDDAYIDYYKAFKIYGNYTKHYGTQIPKILIEDLLRVAKAADRLSEAKRLIRNYRSFKVVDYRKARKLGKIVFIHLNGHSPIKIDKKFTVASPKGPVSVAFPEYSVDYADCRNSNMVVSSGNQTITKKTYLVEDINKIAVKALADRKARIMVKAIARAAIKQVVNKGVSDKIGGVGGLLFRVGFNVFNSTVLEKADVRTWRTLPGEIYMTRAYVKPGPIEVSVSKCGFNKKLENFSIKAGETRFVIYNSIYE